MRCLTLADAMKVEGFTCHFICREQPGHISDRIRGHGHELTLLPRRPGSDLSGVESASTASAYSTWLGCDWPTDAEQTRAVLRSLDADWLIVDHYAIDIRWEMALADAYRRLFVIDDLADRKHCSDVLLDQTFGRGAEAYARLVPAHCRILAGAEYALLRPEFGALRTPSLRRRERPRLEHLLICMGGVDQKNATGRVLDSLATGTLRAGCLVTVAMGGTAPWLGSVVRQAEKMSGNVRVVVDVGDMASLMAASDLALGAAGTTSWERCCLGLPSVAVVLAENQRLVADALVEAGAVLLVEDIDAIPTRLPSLLGQLQQDPSSLARMSQAAARVTEGRGVQLVKEFLHV